MNEKTILSIGEAAELLGVHIDTLRNWERRGLLSPSVTPGGHRRYDRTNLQKLLKEKNMIKQIDNSVQSLLCDQESKKDSHVVQTIQDILDVVERRKSEGMDYGAVVRSLTKALSIVNE